ILDGSLLPTDVFFPGGSVELVQRVYQGDPNADHFHAQVAARVVEAVRARAGAGRAPITVLEVGAGTGGTTRHVLRALTAQDPPLELEYVYTDLSPAFLQHGRTAFAQYPFLAVRTLDVEQDPEVQGFSRGAADVVIAANVLHATQDVGYTLGHVAAL